MSDLVMDGSPFFVSFFIILLIYGFCLICSSFSHSLASSAEIFSARLGFSSSFSGSERALSGSGRASG